MKKFLILTLLVLFGCTTQTVKVADFVENSDIVVIDKILTDKTQKLDFVLEKIEEKNKEINTVYTHDDGTEISVIYNKKTQIKSIKFLKSGKKRMDYGAFIKITKSTLDAFSSFHSSLEASNKMMHAYSKNPEKIVLGDTVYGECTVQYMEGVLQLQFDHK